MFVTNQIKGLERICSVTASHPSLANPIMIGVVRALAEGQTDRECAQRLHISTRTVQRLVDDFKTLASAPTRFAAGAAACRLGLLEASEG